MIKKKAGRNNDIREANEAGDEQQPREDGDRTVKNHREGDKYASQKYTGKYPFELDGRVHGCFVWR